MKQIKNRRKTIKRISKIFNALPFFNGKKRVIAGFIVAALFTTAVNISINQDKNKIFYKPLAAGAGDKIQTPDTLLNIGKVEGLGTHFAVDNSEYLNMTLDASNSIALSLQSIPEMIIMRMAPVENVFSVTITLGGFSPLTLYHKYQDNYANHEPFTTDKSGNYTYIQDLSKAHSVFIQPRLSTNFIKDDLTGGDCVLKNIGTWSPSSKTCTLSVDLGESIQINDNNLTLDGNGHKLTGSKTGYGVSLSGKTGVIIKNLTVNNFTYGVSLDASSDNNTIIGNNLSSNSSNGITLNDGSSDNNVLNNVIKSNGNSGVLAMNYSNGINIRNNEINANKTGIAIAQTGGNGEITGNTIISNTAYGLFLYITSNNKVYNNNFINNTWQAVDQSGRGNVFNLNAPIGGNYWSNWNSPDNNGDRFVDSPYNFTGNRDNLPWVAQNAWLDNIPPTTSINLGGDLGGGDWYRSDVNITLSAVDNDGGSGVAKTEYSFDGSVWTTYTAPFPISGNGTRTLYYRSADNAKNIESTKSRIIKIDKIPPETHINISGTAGNNSWYTSNVSVALGASDNLDGSGTVKTEYSFDNANWNAYASAFVISAEGENLIYFRSADVAGNIEQPKTETIKIDKTAPGITGAAVEPPNSNNWYNRDVAIRFNCYDAVSGPLNPWVDTVIGAEGTNKSADGECIDRAGNKSGAVVSGINIDKTAPTVSVSRDPQANSAGWNNVPVAATFVASDTLSGIDGPTVKTINFNLEGANQSAGSTFKDRAGNSAAGYVSGVNIDLTPPLVSGAAVNFPNTYGWYNTDVIIHYTGSDALSGIDTLTPDEVISTEGNSQSASGSAVDKAGNSAYAAVSGINIDKTGPIISISSPIDKFAYNFGQNVFASWSANDNLSGVSLAIGTVPNGQAIDTQSTGEKKFSVSAEDKAGNKSEKTAVYYVVYIYTGPLPPLSRSGLRTFNYGSAIPVKFQLKDARGNYISNAIAKIYLAKNNGTGFDAEKAGVSSGTANLGNQFRYDAVGSQYIFNLNTQNLSLGTWRIRIALDDGTSKYLDISLK